ncbi:MAG: DUF4249 domain-containing protein [Bacteroidales bacterium]|jgi:hypothetical protein
MFTQKLFGVVLFAALILAGCRERVQDEFPDFNSVPVVNCFLVADSLIKVHVSLAGQMDTLPLALVDNATVTCTINDSAVSKLNSVGNGNYAGDTRIRAGNVCRVNVSVPGFPEMAATDTIPHEVQLTSIRHINEAGVNEEGYPFPAIVISFPVDPGRIQYFQVILNVNSYKEVWWPANFRDFSDTVLLAEGLPIAVFSTARIKTSNYTLKLDYSPNSYSGSNGVIQPDLHPFVVEFKAISYSYYQYLRQLYLYETGRFPDFGFGSYHTYPLYSNITNGMGIVAGYSTFRSETITPQSNRP